MKMGVVCMTDARERISLLARFFSPNFEDVILHFSLSRCSTSGLHHFLYHTVESIHYVHYSNGNKRMDKVYALSVDSEKVK